MLLARLATKRAKPNGQSVINPEEARAVLGDLEVDALPGVGWSLKKKLADMSITHVRQVCTHFAAGGLVLGCTVKARSFCYSSRQPNMPVSRASRGSWLIWVAG